MVSVPKELMEDWINRLEIEYIADCRPAGRPILMISNKRSRWNRILETIRYTPFERLKKHPLLSRKVTRKEYNSVVDYAIDCGINNGFIQEGDVAEESFIPEFDYEGI